MNKQATIQELGMSNKVHLCSSCVNEFPICKNNNIIFGDGKGNDNVCCCDAYSIEKIKIYGAFETVDKDRTIGECVAWSTDIEIARSATKRIGWWNADGILVRQDAIKIGEDYYVIYTTLKESELIIDDVE